MTGNYLWKVIENWGDANDSKLIRFPGVVRQYETGEVADDLEKQEHEKRIDTFTLEKESSYMVWII